MGIAVQVLIYRFVEMLGKIEESLKAPHLDNTEGTVSTRMKVVAMAS
jgi:hypothetical protein